METNITKPDINDIKRLFKNIGIAHLRLLIWFLIFFFITIVPLFILVVIEVLNGKYYDIGTINDIAIVEGITYFGLIFSAAMIMLYDYRKHGKYIKYKKDFLPKYIFAGLIFYGIVTLILSFFPESMMDGYNSQMDNTFSSATILGIALIAPVSEELTFRGIINESLGIINPYYGMVVSSLLFAIMHRHPIQMGYAFLMGMLCCIINKNKGSIFPSIIMHISINTLSVILYLTGLEKIL